MIKKILLSLATVFIFSTSSFGFAPDIVLSEIGARPMGMGKAFTSIPAGPDAISFNPASISFAPTLEITTMQTKILNTVDYRMYAGVLSTKIGSFGISYMTALTPAGYATTTQGSLASAEAMAFTTSTLIFSASQNMTRLMQADARKIGELSVGINYKLMNSFLSGITNGRGSGQEMDIGMLLITPSKLNVGLCMQNTSRADFLWESQTKEKLPSVFRFGLSYPFKNVLLSLDTESSSGENKPALLHLGGEWTPYPGLYIRAGSSQAATGTSSTANTLTFGLGFKYSGVSFDYAYRNDAIQSDFNNQYISLSFATNKLLED